MSRQVEFHLEQDGRVSYMDYLKGFSILTIVLMHLVYRIEALPSQIITLSGIGGSGVHVFFLCSGIGLYLSYLKRKTGFLPFLKKRFTKIYFPYILVILISFCVPWLYNGSDRVTALLSHVFLFKMFVPEYMTSFGGHLWFISTIIQLYLLFIPLCLIKEKLKSNRLFVGIFMAISVGWWIFCYALRIDSIRIWGSFCLQYIWEFALGFAIADALHHGKTFKVNNLVLLVVAVVGISLQAFMAITPIALKVFNDIPALCGYTALALLLSNIPLARTLCQKLSLFSYEFYLVHMGVFSTIFHILAPQTLILQCLVALVAMAAALIASYLYSLLVKKLRLWQVSRHKG